MFSFEAGRRCDSGPGNFTFETKQGNDIFTLVDQAIQSQKAQSEEHRLSCPLGIEQDGCQSSLQQPRGGPPPYSATVASGDSSGSCSSWDDGDSGGSKPGSADGVLGWREGGPAGGPKGRSLPEPPPAPGGGGSSRVQGGAGKGVSSNENAGLYSEPMDSVRLPHPMASDSLYADPVDSIKAQSAANAPLPVPTPRLRPVGGEAVGGDQQQQQQGRKKQDLYSHVYDLITMDLKQKTSLNGGGSGSAGGRWGNRTWQPPGGQTEEGAAPEHIYDEPEGCAAKTSLGSKIQNPATPSPARIVPQLPKWAKPQPAPKPPRSALARKEPPGKLGGGGGSSNNNNNNFVGEMGGVEGGASRELYSQVSKQKVGPAASLWFSPKQQPPLRSPDIIYDNLGHI